MSADAESARDPATTYLDGVRRKLLAERFDLRAAPGFVLAGLRSGFELAKFGHVDRFIAASRRASIDAKDLPQLESATVAATKASIRGFRPPAGLFEGYFCHGVVVVDSVGPELVAAITEHGAGKRFAVFVTRSVYDLSTGRLHVLERRPVWGAMYAGEERELLRRIFA